MIIQIREGHIKINQMLLFYLHSVKTLCIPYRPQHNEILTNTGNYIVMNKLITLLIIAYIFTSCCWDKNKDKRKKTVYVPEVDIYVTTYKREGGDFYVIFDNKKQISQLSDSVDYLKFKTGAFISIMFDTIHKDSIYIYSQFSPDSVNQKKYSFEFIIDRAWESRRKDFFYFPDNKTENIKLKPQYKHLYIETMYYTIDLNGKTVKKGDVFGGTRGR